MCRTAQITYLLCLHTISQTHSCRSLLSLLFKSCQIINSENFINDYCPRCRQFWDQHSISEESRRERAAEFRVDEDYHGPITPSAVPIADGDGAYFGFIKDEGYEEPAKGGIGTGLGEEARYLSELNAKWGVDDDIASISNLRASNEGRRGTKADDRKGGIDDETSTSKRTMNKEKRRDSADSGGTLWPTGETAQKKDGSTRLGPDDYGNDSDVASDWSTGEGVITPEDFDMEHLERRLCGSEENEKRIAKLKPVAPMPRATLQRSIDVASTRVQEFAELPE